MRRVIFSATALFVVTLSFVSIAKADSLQWVYSYDQALSQAKSEDKPVMIDFYTDWCGWCKKLDQETYQDQRVIQASHNFICLKIDAERSPDLAQKYNVSGYPTILFVNTTGKKIGGGSGFRDANKLLSEMNSIFSKFGRSTSGLRTGKTITSSRGAIGAFAKNWRWSKERKQDGEYAETKLNIKLPSRFRKAALILKHNYSQQSGAAQAKVYISTKAQVAPEDEAHYKGNWWVGNAARLGEAIGSFETQYSYGPSAELDVTDFLRRYPSKIYYICVKNLAQADIGINQIYIEVEE